MAKSEKKTTKKSKRRLKRSVRKTLGTLFLISAIVVAAIPTSSFEGGIAQADEVTRSNRTGDYKVTIYKDAASKGSAATQTPTMDTLIPEVKATDKLYSSGTNEDGSIYQFAHVNFNNEWSAVILGYNKGNNLPNNTLTIPNTVNAYIQPTNNLGTTEGYVAVSQSEEVLYYERLTDRTREVEVKDALGKPVYEADGYTPKTTTVAYKHGEILPCYDSDPTWKSLALDKFFYAKAGSTIESETAETDDGDKQTYDGYARTTESAHQWIKDIQVKFIGNQYLETETVSTPDGGSRTQYKLGGYIDEANKSQGIFANAGNIGTLNISENLVGVGNYAFYSCTGLKEISFEKGNALTVIGNHAFESCTSINTVKMPATSNIKQLGDHAFYGCTSLTGLSVPISVSYVGDYCFANCTVLSNIDFCNSGADSMGVSASTLTELGWSVFENDSSLDSFTFPDNYAETVDISMFKGCNNLSFIASHNQAGSVTFTEADGVYTFDEFRKALEASEKVQGKFYFEGYGGTAPNYSNFHKCAQDERFAFSYLTYNTANTRHEKQNKYELTVVENPDASPLSNGTVIYVVNDKNQLIDVTVGSAVSSLTIPNQIGPYFITEITSERFANDCSLKKVTIPENVAAIRAGAFKGCHNLENVIFESGNTVIEAEAFRTQDFSAGMSHKTGCSGTVEKDANNKPAVQLHFVGPISEDSKPFKYAMSYDGRYNNGSQNTSFITYYSGWPTNLTVEYQYDEATGVGTNELVNFPALGELSSYAGNAYDAYMTEEYKEAAREALGLYQSNPSALTEDQKAFIDSALNITIPKGIQSIKDGLFYEKEKLDGPTVMKTVTAYGLDRIDASPDTVSGGDAAGKGDFQGCQSLREITLLGDTKEIDPYAFQDCTGLTKAILSGNIEKIGDYAFKDCEKLSEVSLSDTVSSLGIIPFNGCEVLRNVGFGNSPYYVCSDSIIYELSGGLRTNIIECLEGRDSQYVRSSELAGVTGIKPEAFANTRVKEIDLTGTSILTIPPRAFANTENLRTVKIPHTCISIENYAFDGSNLDYIEIPIDTTLIGNEAFAGALQTQPPQTNKDLTICTPTGSYAFNYANLYGYNTTDMPVQTYYTVQFWDWDEALQKNVQVGETQTVLEGEDAVPPEPRGKEGMIFDKWDPDYREVSGNIWCTAQYKMPPTGYGQFTVTFIDYDDTVLKTVLVDPGASAEPPKDPSREGYVFTGWRPSVDNIQEDTKIYAQYTELGDMEYQVRYFSDDTTVMYTATVKHGQDAPAIQAPAKDGYTFYRWWPAITNVTSNIDTYAQYNSTSGSGTGTGDGSGNQGGDGSGNQGGNGSGSGDGNNNNNNDTTSKFYTLTVRNGSGSGSYVAGSQPIVIANDPAAGQEFSNWSIDPADTKIASKVLTATVITMPEEDVTVTANYKAKSSTSSGGGTTGSSNSSNRPGTTGTLNNGGTTVIINKNGLSNTGVVSATVNGSSDNFTIKISESQSASESVVKALMAEYNNDLSNIKYFPMDISLYDSTGQKKITDTTGLKITITLPLPDSLKEYAGNNKVAGVVNDRLDKLSPRFTTISGVPCITFTAEHFSPYVIYVDTTNLSANGMADSTPKTGDGIHPKWFLSMGLGCLSIVFFMKKDKKKEKRPVKVKA